MSDIFDQTSRPNADLLYHRDDKNDPRLGELVSTDKGDFESSDIVILGCPQDEGIR